MNVIGGSWWWQCVVTVNGDSEWWQCVVIVSGHVTVSLVSVEGV